MNDVKTLPHLLPRFIAALLFLPSLAAPHPGHAAAADAPKNLATTARVSASS